MEESIKFIERFANTESLDDAQIVVGFTDDRTAYIKTRNKGDDEEWSEWAPIGSAFDYNSNEHYAAMSGCPFKVV